MSDTLLQITRQEAIEARYSRKHIDQYIRDSILGNPAMVAKIAQGVQLIEDYKGKTYYASKNTRIAQLDGLDIEALVLDIFVGIAYCQREELFTSVTAQLASRLKFDDKADAIKTVAELVAVLCETDAFDINKASAMASLMIQSQIPLEDTLLEYINNSQYLPPMVCEPLELTNNYSSGYLTHTDSLILRGYNHHDGDICLDVLNTVNRVALRLDTEFVGTVEEDPNAEFTADRAIDAAAEKGKHITQAQALEVVAKQIENWKRFKGQSYEFYLMLATQGNEFYLTNKVDKRGRIYSQGYHLNTQGASHKKACVELAKEELVDGMP